MKGLLVGLDEYSLIQHRKTGTFYRYWDKSPGADRAKNLEGYDIIHATTPDAPLPRKYFGLKRYHIDAYWGKLPE